VPEVRSPFFVTFSERRNLPRFETNLGVESGFWADFAQVHLHIAAIALAGLLTG